MDPRTVAVVEVVGRGVIPPLLVVRGEALLAGLAVQAGGGVDAFGQYPVQAVGNHGGAVPIGGVDEPRRAVRRPTVGDGLVEQRDRGVDQLVTLGRAQRVGQVDEQPRPLQGVAHRGAVGLELVSRLIGVVLGHRRPGLVEVLGDPPPVRRRLAHHEAAHRMCPRQPVAVTRQAGNGQHRLHGVHVGVQPAVGVGHGEVGAPGVDAQAGGAVPEPVEEHGGGVVQQRTCPGDAGLGAGGPGQQDEGMGIARLVGLWSVGSDRGEPPAVLGVAQRAGEAA